MASDTHDQSPAGIIPDAPATTFAEHVAKVNASDAFFEALAEQADGTPIINLNFICCRPRGDATQYEAYGAVAGNEIDNVGGSIAHYAVGITDTGHFSDKWDVVDLPVYPRRASYLQLQKSRNYQLAIPDRIGGTYERLLYVLSDDTEHEPFFADTTSIAELHKTKKALPVDDGEVWVSQLLRFAGPGGRDAFHRYASAFAPILAAAGGKVWLSVRAEMPIVSEEFWDHYTLTRFPSLDAVEGLYQSDDWQAANIDRLKALDGSLVVAANPVDLG